MSRKRLHAMIASIIPNAVKRAAMAYTGQSRTSGQTPRRRGAGSRQAIVRGHFESGNTARYGFVPNSDKYQRRKNATFPGRPQMVRTGRLRESVVGHGDINVPQGNPSGATITWRNLPDYVRHLVAKKQFNLSPDDADQRRIDQVANESVRQDIEALRVATGRSGGAGRVRPGQPPLREPPLTMPPLSS